MKWCFGGGEKYGKILMVFAWRWINSIHSHYCMWKYGENLEQGTLTHRRATQHWIFYFFYYFFSINVVFTWMEEMRFNALPLFGAICIWLQCYSESRIWINQNYVSLPSPKNVKSLTNILTLLLTVYFVLLINHPIFPLWWGQCDFFQLL